MPTGMKKRPKLSDQIFKLFLLLVMVALIFAAVAHFLGGDKVSCILDVVLLIYIRMIYQNLLVSWEDK